VFPEKTNLCFLEAYFDGAGKPTTNKNGIAKGSEGSNQADSSTPGDTIRELIVSHSGRSIG
jgi:hypothetical protein